MPSLNLYIAICKRRETGDPRHWILVMREEGSNESIRYHSTGGPTKGMDYSVAIESKPFESRGIEKHHFICPITYKDKNKIKAVAKRIPGMNCQEWVVNVLRELEMRKIVPLGTSTEWRATME
ncbi:hypothetical protein FLONG3_5162 [Fusarium longipes]|uniref:Uncharacterized protein n=1 Tax=Fusarium longipes TaxID=694270 RepID=A0A395SXC4_9HYPO|nr:hypothetical protein FLONG3_5162 [Fusarium longipes]